MSIKTLIGTLAVGATLAAGALTLAPAFAGADGAPRERDAAGSVSIAGIVERLEAAGYRDIDEIERKARHVEVKATDPDGRRGEFYVDPTSGEVFEAKLKDERRTRRPAGDEDRGGRRDGGVAPAGAGVI